MSRNQPTGFLLGVASLLVMNGLRGTPLPSERPAEPRREQTERQSHAVKAEKPRLGALAKT